MNILSLQNISKSYQDKTIIDSLSFDVKTGTIFGLLGPNGAGKTTVIRMITSITHPDSGRILFNGEQLNSYHPMEIGYLPEERGLYKKMKVGDQLFYLAQLKGLSRKQAQEGIKKWYDKLDISGWHHKRIQELSKGMQQKIQFIATVIHNPKLLILDEPFTGLDPINTQLLLDIIYELKEQGTTIIFSTHRMEQVEEICEKIILINNGNNILEGDVKEIKNKYKKELYVIKSTSDLSQLEGYDFIKTEQENEYQIKLSSSQNPMEMLSKIIESGYEVLSYQEILPSLNEIFIEKVGIASTKNQIENVNV